MRCLILLIMLSLPVMGLTQDPQPAAKNQVEALGKPLYNPFVERYILDELKQLRAGQDSNPHNKIAIYDQILKLRSDDCEALTYKADTVLELDEPQWAINLCTQALAIDPDNSHAFYQLACAYTAMGQCEEAVHYLSEALQRAEHYRDELPKDPALQPLQNYPAFQQLLPDHKNT